MNTLALLTFPATATAAANTAAAATATTAAAAPAAPAAGLTLGGWATMLCVTIGVTLFFIWCLARVLRAK
ncbi:MAG: hypothetical protein LBT53_09685 [Puniceicoccales bacterium]|jgi:hypothetical protein|nr:hypothetical protein [Puniceicoccales bacterium]